MTRTVAGSAVQVAVDKTGGCQFRNRLTPSAFAGRASRSAPSLGSRDGAGFPFAGACNGQKLATHRPACSRSRTEPRMLMASSTSAAVMTAGGTKGGFIQPLVGRRVLTVSSMSVRSRNPTYCFAIFLAVALGRPAIESASRCIQYLRSHSSGSRS